MRLLSCLCLLVLAFQTFIPTGQARVHVSAQNAVLIEQDSGEVLFEHNAHERQSVASITKVMTAIIAIESNQMDDMIKASRNAIHTEGSSIYLEEGEKMQLEDLIYGLMLRSGNDAAMAIAEHIGESEEGFVYLMNEKARWIGMTNTNFANPHGLEEDNHYSTAYDMAILMQYAMNDETFREISGTSMHTANTRTYGWQNKNKLLTQLYENTTGGKTGFTKKAGRTLVTTAEKNEHELIAVTLNAPDDWNDHIHLYTDGFDQLENEETFSYPTVDDSQSSATNENDEVPIELVVIQLFKQILRVNPHG